MRAMLCGCRRHLDATDEEELFGKVVEHLRRDHRLSRIDEVKVKETVAGNSYRYECVELPADTAEAVEGYGPEPY
jgi:predicted small metal-binding protein